MPTAAEDDRPVEDAAGVADEVGEVVGTTTAAVVEDAGAVEVEDEDEEVEDLFKEHMPF